MVLSLKYILYSIYSVYIYTHTLIVYILFFMVVYSTSTFRKVNINYAYLPNNYKLVYLLEAIFFFVSCNLEQFLFKLHN